MADYSATVATSQTLTAGDVDAVTLTDVGGGYGRTTPTITVVNRTGADELFITVGTANTVPVDPTVGGVDCYCIAAKVGESRSFPASAGPVTVKVISNGAMAYSVEAL